jgi:two-component system, cell cycle sensor histidine kinase and response regulator CckA
VVIPDVPQRDDRRDSLEHLVNREHIVAVLYDMAMVIGGEVELRPLLTRCLQRLLYHTSLPVGLVFLDVPPASAGAVEARLELVIGDHELADLAGRKLTLPAGLLVGEAAFSEDPALLSLLPGTSRRYRTFLRLPVDRQGVILLLDHRPPRGELPLPHVFQPVMANLARAIVLCRDHEARSAGLVAERDEARRGFEESAGTLRAMSEAAFDAIITCDSDGRISYWNPAAAKVFGYPAEEAMGRMLHELLPALRYRDPASAGLRRFRETGQGPALGHTLELEAVRKDGSEFPCELSISPIRLGGQWHAVGILRDITERRQIEEALRRSQKLDALGQVAGGVAHDFNNLLVVIKSYAELALGSLPATAPQREDLAQVVLAGRRAAALTRQLLAFSRQQVLQPVVLSLNGVIHDFEKMLRRIIGEEIELRTKLSGDLGSVLADPSQLEQILFNLVVNARDAMPGGGSILIETAEAELSGERVRGYSDVKPGRYVVLSVTDTGCGIDETTMRQMFQPFFTTKAPGKGTGLGLATVYGIVKQSHGHVEVQSEVGKGTTFRIYLPRSAAQAEAAAPEPAPCAGGTETILVAEDDLSVLRLTERALTSLGYQVLATGGATEALALLATHPGPVHLLLIDVVMPVMAGPALADRVLALRPKVAVLYMSGYPGDVLARHGGLAPEASFIQKPFTATALGRKVREMLDRVRT